MKTKLLLGATTLALGMLGATGAWANPQNVFSDGSRNTVTSSASTGGITVGYNTCYSNCGHNRDPGGTANSESFNVNQNAVSYQEMSATSDGSINAACTIFGRASVSTGNASINGGSNNAGVSSFSSNTGNGTASQQGVSLAALGTVNVGR